MKDLKKVQEFFSKPMGEGYYEFDMGDEGPDYNSISSLEDELRRLIRFSNQYGSKGADAKIEQLKQRITQLKNQVNLEEITNDYSPLSYATLVAKGKMDIEDAMKETGFSYVLLKQLVDKVKGVAQNIREEEEDPTDIIAMDVPLFIRMLEWAREDAETDMDLHNATERAIEAVKLRGLLSMEDYNDIIGEPIEEMTGYSKYLATPENPKGKTQGLTQDVMDKILLKIATMGDDDVEETTRLGEGVIYEELCPKGKAYIKKRQAAGEKSSAYLSGRAVKVCKGQMKG